MYLIFKIYCHFLHDLNIIFAGFFIATHRKTPEKI